MRVIVTMFGLARPATFIGLLESDDDDHDDLVVVRLDGDGLLVRAVLPTHVALAPLTVQPIVQPIPTIVPT